MGVLTRVEAMIDTVRHLDSARRKGEAPNYIADFDRQLKKESEGREGWFDLLGGRLGCLSSKVNCEYGVRTLLVHLRRVVRTLGTSICGDVS